MKKALVIAITAIMIVSAVFVLAACAKEQTYNGEYSYANPWDATKQYGVKVKVTVKGKVITKVEITSENTDAYTNLSASWGDKQLWIDGEEEFLKSFEGMKVSDVKAITVKLKDNGEPYVKEDDNTPVKCLDKVGDLKVVTGATQSTARVILAVQNALKDVK